MIPIHQPLCAWPIFNPMVRVSTVFVLGWWVFCPGAGSVWAVDAERGKVLHDKACIACHASLTGGSPTALYTREDRRIQSVAALRKRVQRCSLAAGVSSWSPEALEAVVAYLNRTFYHFGDDGVLGK